MDGLLHRIKIPERLHKNTLILLDWDDTVFATRIYKNNQKTIPNTLAGPSRKQFGDAILKFL